MNYESDATFTVSFWFTKEVCSAPPTVAWAPSPFHTTHYRVIANHQGCTGGIYEYMFSDHATVDSTMWDTPYLDIYIGCETSGGGWSTLDGTLRNGQSRN